MAAGRSFLDFSGRAVLVSGASSGLGRAIALELSRHGARVVVSGRDRGRLEETAAGLEGQGHLLLPLDLSRLDEIQPALQGAREKVGRLYGLCHAAGVAATRPLGASSPALVHSQLEVSLVAGLELARAVCHRAALEEEGGSLLFISSAYAHIGVPGQSAYSAAKGGLRAAARALAVELARRNVRVNTLSPGLVDTPMTSQALAPLSGEQREALRRAHPLRTGTPEDVARAAVFLLAPSSSWITGADLAIDGGLTAC